ncbi:hypothetical protein SNOG_09086 [Parastagonospora nodorum SN15]|uniref:BZIP domain-containing protein n=1 Tax=Phaeosphaeria nodorum (strain SN15 / ATCC MYA-4574 / FGSC 10173) TaxID=321614 RepID=Q0UGM8_PHANO|nr:hypothetical protein SNOG_09086 [Parastagonospora nodorum SN15]EAT83278.2 hypothetical protein SNOG_09086 [Parastagonospora nodorum SN15]
MAKKGDDTASALRIRENQRRSRNRRKELIDELQGRIQKYEREGVAATQEMQRAARKVAEENARLRSLLAHHGILQDEVDAFLRSCDEPALPNDASLNTSVPSAQQPGAVPVNALVTAPNEAQFSDNGNGLEISCETAATIIVEMRGDGDVDSIRASLGCTSREECSVRNSTVLQIMDEG